MVKIVTLKPVETFGYECLCGSFGAGFLSFDDAEKDVVRHYTAKLQYHEWLGLRMPEVFKEVKSDVLV